MSGLLDRISTPADVRALADDKLGELASEIRERIISVVGQTGGHLASNLGVVELTIALHRAFDFRVDRLVFDVGHQAYCHKMLTGRNDRFDTLRQKGGLSGYPHPAESEYDHFVVGHASTAISQALGLACAAELGGETRRVVAIVGDGSMTGGLAYEGLNQAGHLGKRMLVVLNDNAMAISPTVGALQGYLGRMRAVPLYNELRNELFEALLKIPVVGKSMEGLVERVLEVARRVLTPGHIFHELGFRYFGPVDGHDMQELVSALDDVKKLSGPILLHVLTEKGRGFTPASDDPAKFHSATPQSVAAGFADSAPEPEPGTAAVPYSSPEPPESPERPGSEPYTKVFSRELRRVAESDPSVVAITAAMPSGTGLDAFAREFPNRYFDAGIAEQHAISFAGALSRGGLRPVVVIYSTFLQRAYDQIFHDLCLQPDCAAVIGVDRAGVVGSDGPTHHGVFDIAYLRSLPRIVLCAPKDAAEVGPMLEMAVASGAPVAMRYPRDFAPALTGVGEPAAVELGVCEVLRDGDDCTVLAYGAGVEWALGAAEELSGEGIQCRVVNARFAKPLDEEMVREAFSEAGRPVVSVEDGALAGGFGSGVLECAAGMGLDTSRAVRLGVPDRFVEHGRRSELLEELGLSAAGIAGRIRKELER